MKRDWHDSEFRVLVTFGESTTAGGRSARRETCWTSRLGALISEVQSRPVEVINSGIGANLITDRSPGHAKGIGKPAANVRLDKHVIAHKPDLLIISYGLNDARVGTSPALFAEEMSNIIDRVRAECDPLIVLPGPYFMTDFTVGGEHWSHGGLDTFHAYNDVTSGVATAKDCLFVDLLSAYEEAPWMVHFDGVHANDLGHLVVANRIFEVLAKNCSGLSLRVKADEEKAGWWRDESGLRADYGVE